MEILEWLKEYWWILGIISVLAGVQFVTPKKINIGEILYNILYTIMTPLRFLIIGKDVSLSKKRAAEMLEIIRRGQELDEQYIEDNKKLRLLEEQRMRDMEKVDDTNKLVLAMARNTILKICDDYLSKGEIPYLSLEVLNTLFEEYEAQGGNGGVKVKVQDVNNLPRI